jgi:hypothetical protein
MIGELALCFVLFGLAMWLVSAIAFVIVVRRHDQAMPYEPLVSARGHDHAARAAEIWRHIEWHELSTDELTDELRTMQEWDEKRVNQIRTMLAWHDERLEALDGELNSITDRAEASADGYED